MEAYYGARARLGLIVPPNNTVSESEWASMMPAGVTMHSLRIKLNPLARSEAEQAVLRESLREACLLFAEADMSGLIFACTAPSAISPRHAMEAMMHGTVGLPSVTAAAAVVDAIVALSAKNVVLMSPFSAAVTAHEADFMTTEGIRVLSQHSLGHGTYAPGRKLEIHTIPPSDVCAAVSRIDYAEADAIVISGTNLVTFPVIEEIEALTGKPVISSNQAMLWSALRKVSVQDRLPLGALFTRA
jgi:maleate cis-trans isomerase